MTRQKISGFIFLIISLLLNVNQGLAQIQNNQQSEQPQRGIQYVRPVKQTDENFKLFECMAVSVDVV